MEKLPLYYADIIFEDENSGVDKISLVESPAFEHDIIKYSGEKIKYKITNNELREVMGVVILANTPVLRDYPLGNLHYVSYSPKIIRKIRDKFFRKKYNDSVNIHHCTDVDNVFIVESIIKDSNKNIIAGFEDVPDGSWIITFKVLNDEIWERINNGEFNGFSMEIDHEFIDSGKYIETNYSKNKINFSMIEKIKKQNNFRINYKKITGKAPSKFKYESIQTNKGELAFDGELIVDKEGVQLFTDGNDPIIAPDGDYMLETNDEHNGRIITVNNGTITAISDPNGTDNNESIEDTSDNRTEESGSTAAEEAQETAAVASIEAHIEAIDALQEAFSGYINDHLEDVKQEVSELTSNTTESVNYMKIEINKLNTLLTSIATKLNAPVIEPEKEKNTYSKTGTNGPGKLSNEEFEKLFFKK